MRLAGKIGIVVGAGQTPGETIGIGRAAALLFAREGAKVLLVDRDASRADETAELISREGGEASTFAGDWTKAADTKAYARACIDAWGRIDFLHNNVGISEGDTVPADLSEDVFDRVMQVNLKGCLLSCQAVLPIMIAQRGGSVVNISSVASIAYAAPLTAYKLSKIGVNALGQQLALHHAKDGVRVNTVMPGFMDTPMAIEAPSRAMKISKQELRAKRDAYVPVGRMGSAWDVAYAALFLHSDEAKFITGVVLPVDGGQSARVG